MQRPRTKYAKSGKVNVAYQVFGSGAIDFVYVPGWISDVEAAWDEPQFAQFLRRLGGFTRVIMFDKRGTGLSDRDVGYPTLEERMDDVRAVMDAAGSERAVIFGQSEGGGMSCLFAATYPERTRALVLFGAFAKRSRSPDYPWAPAREEREKWIAEIEDSWGQTTDVFDLAPSRTGDEAFAEWYATMSRRAASPGSAVMLARTNTDIDVRAVLPAINVPTLVMQRRGDRDVKVGEAEFIVFQIPGAKLCLMDGDDHIFWCGDGATVLGEIEEFITGSRPAPAVDRVLATVLATDIVDSTRRATDLGDTAWTMLLERHHLALRREIKRFNGAEINTAGDSFMVAFDGPGRAVRCAFAMHEAVRPLGLEIRAGLHAGECVLAGGAHSGIALHVAARVAAKAGAGQTLTSRTVKDLCIGSGITFQSMGSFALKGLDDSWEVCAASEVRAPSA
jgi:pimeloyl-ACP methyl ester carboxylesterase/class 3 adenylate cyclase